MYRRRADCERRIKELKADFGLDSFVLRDFWATEAALGVTMLAVGAFWDNPQIKPNRPTLSVAVARQRRQWFEGLWANAGEPVTLKQA